MPLYGSTSAALWADIGRVKLTATATQIEFTNIPQTYRHLKLFFNGRLATGTAQVQTIDVRLNGDSGTNYDVSFGRALNAVASANQFDARSSLELLVNDANATAAQPSTAEITIADYASTTFRKTVRMQSMSWYANLANNYGEVRDALWENTAAVTSILMLPRASATFAIGTTAELYGIG